MAAQSDAERYPHAWFRKAPAPTFTGDVGAVCIVPTRGKDAEDWTKAALRIVVAEKKKLSGFQMVARRRWIVRPERSATPPPPPPPAPAPAPAPAPVLPEWVPPAEKKRSLAWCRVEKFAQQSYQRNVYRRRTGRSTTLSALLVRKGIISRPALRSKAPRWWKMPEHAIVAAEVFDETHYVHQERAESLLKVAGRRPTTDEQHRVFNRAVRDVANDRYFVPELAGEIPDIVVRQFKSVEKVEAMMQPWSLDKSIWKPRKAWAESRDYHETEAFLRSCLELDWEQCLVSHNTRGFLMKQDESAHCLSACFDVLWDNAELIYSIYDFYSTLGSTDDIFHINLNAFKALIDDCDIYVPGSKTCNLTAFDQLFILVNAGTDEAGMQKKGRMLDRREWIEMLVRMAVLRFVSTGEFTSVPAALRQLINFKFLPNVNRHAIYDRRMYRNEHCYIQDVDDILQSYKESLMAIFTIYARGEGHVGDKMDDLKILSYVEWKDLVKEFKLIGNDFTTTEQDLAFTWSRMRVLDDRKLASRRKVHQICFEDFLEVIVHCACFMCLPTDMQIYEHGFEDAGAMILTLRNDRPAEYAAFLSQNMRRSDEPLNQPIFRLVDHMCTLMIRTVMQEAKDVTDLEGLTLEHMVLFRKKARDSLVFGNG